MGGLWKTSILSYNVFLRYIGKLQKRTQKGSKGLNMVFIFSVSLSIYLIRFSRCPIQTANMCVPCKVARFFLSSCQTFTHKVGLKKAFIYLLSTAIWCNIKTRHNVKAVMYCQYICTTKVLVVFIMLIIEKSVAYKTAFYPIISFLPHDLEVQW